MIVNGMWLMQVEVCNDTDDNVMCLLLQVDSKLELIGMFDGEGSYEIIVVLKYSVEFVRKARTDDATLMILNQFCYNHLKPI